MKLTLTLTIILVLLFNIKSFSQNNSEEKGAGAIKVIGAISDKVIPGLFTGIQTIIESNKAKNKKYDEIVIEHGKLKSKYDDLQELSKISLDELLSYYEDELIDIKTINDVFENIRYFTQDVNSTIVLSELVGREDIPSLEYKNLLLNKFLTKTYAMVDRFGDLNKISLKSKSPNLNSLMRIELDKIKRIIDDLKASKLVGDADAGRKEPDANKMIVSIKSMIDPTNPNSITQLQSAVTVINTNLSTYIDTYYNKLDGIKKKVEKQKEKME